MAILCVEPGEKEESRTKKFTGLAIPNASGLVFGKAVTPVHTRRGLTIGQGEVYPELNFTLPPMEINDSTLLDIRTMYHAIVEEACARTCELGMPGLVIEFETLIEMTLQPRYATEITSVINEVLERFHANHGLRCALRITPNDTRDKERPPRMRSGPLFENMLRTFEQCARAGADLLSIESTGGKEIHDDALVSCDIEKVLFALSVLGCRDMAFLWERITDVAVRTGTIPAGDTACGFGNTAMVLADRHFIPKVFAAVVRAMTIPRSLVAHEKGAVGPGKDCGYENPFLKAITGFPMSMEGKAAACAHPSPVGNIAAVACDLWSNESVQNVKLLGGMAPTVSLEQLVYDCRLMNAAHQKDCGVQLRDLFAESDMRHDPQAYILTPDNVIRIASAVVCEKSWYRATLSAGRAALDIMRDGLRSGGLRIPEQEIPWLDTMQSVLEEVPPLEDAFIERILPTLDHDKFVMRDYDL